MGVGLVCDVCVYVCRHIPQDRPRLKDSGGYAIRDPAKFRAENNAPDGGASKSTPRKEKDSTKKEKEGDAKDKDRGKDRDRNEKRDKR